MRHNFKCSIGKLKYEKLRFEEIIEFFFAIFRTFRPNLKSEGNYVSRKVILRNDFIMVSFKIYMYLWNLKLLLCQIKNSLILCFKKSDYFINVFIHLVNWSNENFQDFHFVIKLISDSYTVKMSLKWRKLNQCHKKKATKEANKTSKDIITLLKKSLFLGGESEP